MHCTVWFPIVKYVNGLTDKLLQTQKSDIKKYWELLKGVACMKYPSLSTSFFFEHFKSLHCPNQLELYITEDEVKDFMDNYIRNDAVYLELDQPFTMSEFIKCIKSLKTGNAQDQMV